MIYRFSLFLAFTLLTFCDTNVNEELIEYTLINESDHQIRIISSPTEQWFTEAKDEITIKIGETYTEKRVWNERYDINNAIQTFLGTDSVNIIFGNIRKSTYSLNEDFNSISCPNYKNFLRVSPEEGVNYVRHTFTNDDFDCAIDCENSCF